MIDFAVQKVQSIYYFFQDKEAFFSEVLLFSFRCQPFEILVSDSSG